LLKKGYPLAEIVVLLYVAEEGRVDARISVLAREFGYTPQRMSQALSALESRGVIKRIREDGKSLAEITDKEECVAPQTENASGEERAEKKVEANHPPEGEHLRYVRPTRGDAGA
jgi:DNA-binding MarR family transcriptional regulator